MILEEISIGFKMTFYKTNILALLMILTSLGMMVLGYFFRYTSGFVIKGYISRSDLVFAKELYSTGGDDDLIMTITIFPSFFIFLLALIYLFKKSKIILGLVTFWFCMDFLVLHLLEMSSVSRLLYHTIIYGKNYILFGWVVCFFILFIVILSEWFSFLKRKLI